MLVTGKLSSSLSLETIFLFQRKLCPAHAFEPNSSECGSWLLITRGVWIWNPAGREHLHLSRPIMLVH